MMAPLSTLKVRHLIGQLPWIYIARSERTYSGVFMVQSLLPPAGPHLPGLGSVLGVRSRVSPKLLKVVQNLPTNLSVLWPVTTHCAWIDTSGEVETQLRKTTEQATWLKKETPLVGLFLTWVI